MSTTSNPKEIEMKWYVKQPAKRNKNKETIARMWQNRIDELMVKAPENSLKALIDYYNDHQTDGGALPVKICFALYSLMTHYQTTQRKGFKFLPTPIAVESLELFCFLIQSDRSFQDIIETMSVSQVADDFKFNAHLNSGDDNEILVMQTIVLFLSQNYFKFSNWRDYIKPTFHNLIATEIEAVKPEEIPEGRFSTGNYMPTEGHYYDVDIPTTLQTFRTDLKTGLPAHEVQSRRENYGTNELPKPPKKNIFKMFWTQLTDFIVMILIVGTIISLGIQEWIAAGMLTLVIVSNIIIGFTQEYKAERALEALQNFDVTHVNVIRDSEEVIVTAEELVPGDVVVLDEGCSIPADLRLCETHHLETVEVLLTGEMNSIEKFTEPIKSSNVTVGDRKNIAFMSTNVVKGRGIGVVVATGKVTEIGKISSELNKKIDKTMPLKRKLSALGKWLVLIACVLCLFVVALLVTWLFIKNGKMDWDDTESVIKIGLSLAVSVIPEGLVAVVTITMSLGVSRMSKHNVIIRNLPVVEGLGSVTTICTDKTGTLTQGRMTMTEIRQGLNVYSFKTIEKKLVKYNSIGAEIEQLPTDCDELLKVCAICNNSSTKENDNGKMEMIGDPTEIALFVVAETLGVTKSGYTKSGYSFVTEVPFDSDRKRMSVLYKNAQNMGFVYAKGACESILTLCKENYDHKPLDANNLKEIETQMDEMAVAGSRVLACAIRTINLNEHNITEDNNTEIEKDLTFVGLVGIVDPPRNESAMAVKALKAAGINVRIITGDHPKTAGAIAKQIGVIEEDEDADQFVMTGSELFGITEKKLSERDPFPSVFARVSPEDKLKVVKALKRRGEVVAMTGDGVNDAPAIKSANIGISMGSGTDLTKQSADIVLLDDNFYNIVATIKEGRRVYDNILKFVMYLLSANSSEIWTMMICVACGQAPPFSAIMILWANLVVDIPPSICLGLDPPSMNIMERKPRNPNDGIFNWKKALLVLFQGFLMAFLAVCAYFATLYIKPLREFGHYTLPDGLTDEEPNKSRTLAFIGLSVVQLVHAFISKSMTNMTINRDLLRNKTLLIGIFISIVLLVCGCYIPYVNDILEQYPLNWLDWLIICVMVVVHFTICETIKWILRIIIKKKENKAMLFHEDL
ncbi:cation-transporting ATPase pacL, putative [Entamoeba invadens IP1]|uniref:cation-transporting ATPase pacL, putative n=1 Tax=Entamoeba invadens IP1 TaxID=370355 RepID=UPI0002C3E97F|nr:cation-transporting ATPase pacL, putative [Entamoeba invadens IP1]ELP85145.1 cation-transporting ATPase pacL, putative [Entamoeba invadens IP1]|eukprot:XP_004184491.1 cation-transporting ATPase pacL, putative [Entamoeba invadens IP1]